MVLCIFSGSETGHNEILIVLKDSILIFLKDSVPPPWYISIFDMCITLYQFMHLYKK